MTFNKYNITNNAICSLDLPVTNTSNLFVLKGNYDRLPTSNFILKVTEYSGTNIIGRENILFSLRSGNIATVSQRAIEPVPIDDNASENIQQALSFSANSICELVISAEVIKDIQNEVENKLNTDGGLRTGLNTNTVYFSDNSGNEISVNIGALGEVLTSNGPTEAPSFEAPTVSITSLTEDTTGDITSDFFVKNNGTGLNTKIKLNKYNASDAEALAGVNASKYINPKQLHDNIKDAFGAKVSKTIGINYLADTSGIITVVATNTSSPNSMSLNGYSDNIATPSTLVAASAYGSNAGANRCSICFPVVKGNYYRVEWGFSTGGVQTINYTFTPNK